MLLARLLNACHHFPGFVYAAVRLIQATATIQVNVRPHRGSKACRSCCGKPAPGYDVQLAAWPCRPRARRALQGA